MIKNFSNKLVGRVLHMPIWSAMGQEYLVTSVNETYDDDKNYWRGHSSLTMKHSVYSYSVPSKINVTVKKYQNDLDFTVEVEHTLDEGGTRNFNVLATPERLKSPLEFSKLITEIINDTD